MRWILLPGMDGVGLFSQFIEALGPDQDFLVLSYPTNLPLSYDQLTTLVRESLQDETDYILIAESFSGPIAIRLATERPPGLRALILAASFCRSPVVGLSAILLSKIGVSLFRVRPPLRAVKYFLLGNGASKQLIDEFYTAIGLVSIKTLAFRLKEILKVNACNCCADILVPTLYIQANKDRLVGPQEAQVIGHAVADFDLHQIDAPHMVLQRQPALSYLAIRDFLISHKILTTEL